MSRYCFRAWKQACTCTCIGVLALLSEVGFNACMPFAISSWPLLAGWRMSGSSFQARTAPAVLLVGMSILGAEAPHKHPSLLFHDLQVQRRPPWPGCFCVGLCWYGLWCCCWWLIMQWHARLQVRGRGASPSLRSGRTIVMRSGRTMVRSQTRRRSMRSRLAATRRTPTRVRTAATCLWQHAEQGR